MAQFELDPLEKILPEHVQEQLKQPICIPTPEVNVPEINLPTGTTLKGVVDITKGIPNDCSLSFSLMLQLPPLLANLNCIIKMLALLKPMTDVISGLSKVPPEPPSPELAADMAKAVEEVLPCFELAVPGLPWKNLIRDILCLIIKIMRCMLQYWASVLDMMDGLTLDLESAQQAGNTDLVAALQCAQDDATASMANSMTAIEPVTELLGLVKPFLGLAGVDPIEIPTFTDPENLEEAREQIETVKSFVDTLQLVADGLGGCP